MEVSSMASHPIEEILHPRSIAVVGASDSGRGGSFVSPLQELDFKGKIYPVNPKYKEIMGMKAYPRVRDIPEPVDYVISSVPAPEVLGMIEDCAQKGVRAVHLYTARFSETGRKDASDLEQEILRQARKAGIRLIGPNCMGLYYPDEGIAFNNGMPKESGRVGLASQSGQAVGEIVGFAAQRGVRFSKAISYGNALDFNECDYLEYFTQDPQTEVILMYIEGVRDGRRFQHLLRQAAEIKPVIVVKGGRGEAGTRATASHTASMAGSRQIWEALVDQTGIVNAADTEELVDICVAFNFLPRITGRNVGVAGGGGGSSVLAADLCEEAGLHVIPLPQDIREGMKKHGSPIWDWIGNPADFSISVGDRLDIALVIEMMAKHPDFDFLIVFVHGPWRMGSKPFSLDAHMEQFKLHLKTEKPFLTIFADMPRGSRKEAEEFEKIMTEIKTRLISDNLPTYPNMSRAARAVSKMIGYYEKKRKE
jgi:acyl-CoA synthetase (NDP forming)